MLIVRSVKERFPPRIRVGSCSSSSSGSGWSIVHLIERPTDVSPSVERSGVVVDVEIPTWLTRGITTRTCWGVGIKVGTAPHIVGASLDKHPREVVKTGGWYCGSGGISGTVVNESVPSFQ